MSPADLKLAAATPVRPTVAFSPGIRRSMQANLPRDTRPEIALRSALHREGLRFRKHYRPIKGLRCEVDIAFPRAGLAVYLDGCFWHSCPIHGSLPMTNRDWWKWKLDTTKVRDKRNNAALRAAGWWVLRAWEHESVEQIAERVRTALRRRAI